MGAHHQRPARSAALLGRAIGTGDGDGDLLAGAAHPSPLRLAHPDLGRTRACDNPAVGKLDASLGLDLRRDAKHALGGDPAHAVDLLAQRP